ncbi:MAG: ribulose-phosphate 3-epimerase [Alphaproteobacteria bacterium]|nr:ribulose-phosphate 3-epimerase [Alphaproteobacteria bacterium]
MVLIAPSILSADFSRLKEEIKALEKAGADMIHLDVMDGHFVPNLTFGALVVKAIRKCTKLPLDVHLMVKNPKKMLEWFRDSGADILTVHAESSSNLEALIDQIKGYGLKAGVALNPSTDEQVIQKVLNKTDIIMVMSVNPGFGGQSFMPATLDKIKRIKKMIKKRNILIEVDGGINSLNAKDCVLAGADILVAGTAVFKGGNYQKNIESLR